MSTTSWVANLMTEPDFGDVRLDKRLLVLLDQLAAQPTASLPQACGDWKNTKAAYRFLNSEKVTPKGIRDTHYFQTWRRLLGEDRILALTDTTDLDLSSKPQMQGVGPLGAKKTQGLKVHSVLLATPRGVPLGLVAQNVWARDPTKTGQSKDWRKRPLEEKESRKWLTALEETERAVPENRCVVLIGDREADLFPLFAAARRPKTDFLVRAAYDRRVTEEAHTIKAALAQAPVAGTQTLSLRSREGKPSREAVLTVRFATVTLLAPAYYKGEYENVTLQAIEAVETAPPAGEAPLRWILLTTLPVTDFVGACECLVWYGHRWLIEQYHRVLKSGCRIEEMQLQTAARLEVALALYCIVAWRLLWLTFQARETPDVSCERILEPHQWQALYCAVHQTPLAPEKPPSFRQAIRWMAQLGGFLARKGDGEPGVQTLWRGWQRLQDIAETWKLLQPKKTYG